MVWCPSSKSAGTAPTTSGGALGTSSPPYKVYHWDLGLKQLLPFFFTTSWTSFQDVSSVLSVMVRGFSPAKFLQRGRILMGSLCVSLRNAFTSSLGLLCLPDFASPSKDLVKLYGSLMNWALLFSFSLLCFLDLCALLSLLRWSWSLLGDPCFVRPVKAFDLLP